MATISGYSTLSRALFQDTLECFVQQTSLVGDKEHIDLTKEHIDLTKEYIDLALNIIRDRRIFFACASFTAVALIVNAFTDENSEIRKYTKYVAAAGAVISLAMLAKIYSATNFLFNNNEMTLFILNILLTTRINLQKASIFQAANPSSHVAIDFRRMCKGIQFLKISPENLARLQEWNLVDKNGNVIETARRVLMSILDKPK